MAKCLIMTAFVASIYFVVISEGQGSKSGVESGDEDSLSDDNQPDRHSEDENSGEKEARTGRKCTGRRPPPPPPPEGWKPPTEGWGPPQRGRRHRPPTLSGLRQFDHGGSGDSAGSRNSEGQRSKSAVESGDEDRISDDNPPDRRSKDENSGEKEAKTGRKCTCRPPPPPPEGWGPPPEGWRPPQRGRRHRPPKHWGPRQFDHRGPGDSAGPGNSEGQRSKSGVKSGDEDSLSDDNPPDRHSEDENSGEKEAKPGRKCTCRSPPPPLEGWGPPQEGWGPPERGRRHRPPKHWGPRQFDHGGSGDSAGPGNSEVRSTDSEGNYDSQRNRQQRDYEGGQESRRDRGSSSDYGRGPSRNRGLRG